MNLGHIFQLSTTTGDNPIAHGPLREERTNEKANQQACCGTIWMDI